MKVVLCAINSRYSQTSPAIRSLVLFTKCQSSTGRLPAEIEIAEYTTAQPVDGIARDLYARDGQLYAFSVYIWNRRQTFDVIAQLRGMRPDAWIIAGGPEVSFDTTVILEKHSELDLIISGEGEKPFFDLLNRLTVGRDTLDERREGNKFLKDIAGLSFRHDGMIVINPMDPMPLDLSTLPFPYEEDLATVTDRMLYYESSRGCPFRCSYCVSSIEKTVRYRPLSQTIDHLDRFIEAGARLVKLVDRTFNSDPARAREIWRHLIQRHLSHPFKTVFHFEIAGDLLTDQDIDLLTNAPAGLFQLEIGVQTTAPDTLKRINRPCHLEVLFQRVRQLKKAGRQHLHLDLIAGLPGERLEQVIESFNQLYRLSADNLQLGFLKLLPGTPILREIDACQYRYQPFPPYEVLSTKDLSAGELCRLHEVEDVLELFSNSALFSFTMPFLVHQFESPYAFFESLAVDRIQSKDNGRSLSVDDRAVFLSRFATQRLSPSGKETVDGLLRLDHYRNGRKDPPVFLGALESTADAQQKDLITALRRRLLPGRRIRIESVPFSARFLFENGELPKIAAKTEPDETKAGPTAKNTGEWVVYDLSGPAVDVYKVLSQPPKDQARVEKWLSNAADASS